MSDLKIIQPLTITEVMVGSGAGTVAEGDYPEYASGTTYAANDSVIVKNGFGEFGEPATTDTWGTIMGMCIARNGDIYIAVLGGYIYKRAFDGTGTFSKQDSLSKQWTGLCSAPNGDIYACEQGISANGKIYKQTAGSGTFTDTGDTARDWTGICATPAGQVFACVFGGDIYHSLDGSGAFHTHSIGAKVWYGMTGAANGDVYACEYGGDMWVSTNAGVAFSAIADTNRDWRGVSAAANGDIFVCDDASNAIYKRTAGAGTFADTGNASRAWYAIAAAYWDTDADMYASVFNSYLYTSRLQTIHKIYESLVGSNLGNYPPSDVLVATPKWLEVGATNKWKVFDGKLNAQTSLVSPIVYTITPGVAVDSIALLNLSMTSYRVQGTSGAYDSGTVSSTANDIVLFGLGGLAANVLTITVTNSGGLAKCGEIVIGTASTIGTLRPLPTVGITDYSSKVQDEFGNWTIVERTYSEKMSCAVNITYSSLDAVIAVLKDYRASPLVWVGDTSYACLILYGFVKDWSVPVATRGKAIMSLEVEGLT
jgi:hypothetical protein